VIKGIDSSWPQGASFNPAGHGDFVIVGSSTGDYGGKLLAFDSTPPQIDRARAAGMKVGHYFYNGGDAKAGARFFVKHLHDFRDGDILALDLEGSALWSPAQAVMAAREIHELTGVPFEHIPAYMNRNVNHGHDWSGLAALGCPLWYARPDGDPHDQKWWKSWVIRQTGIVAGVDQDEADPAFVKGWGTGTETAGKPTHHTSKPKSKRPSVAPKKPPKYPLPSGWYFGPEAGPRESVSGWHGHRDDVKRAQRQLHDRGYSLAVDGYYSHRGDTRPAQSTTGSTVIAFQKDKHLVPDGLLGIKTWNAMWEEPVT